MSGNGYGNTWKYCVTRVLEKHLRPPPIVKHIKISHKLSKSSLQLKNIQKSVKKSKKFEKIAKY